MQRIVKEDRMEGEEKEEVEDGIITVFEEKMRGESVWERIQRERGSKVTKHK